MRHTYLRRQDGCRRLILVFAGWSTGPSFYTDFIRNGWDIMVCYDYEDFTLDTSIFRQYDTIYLYAWSLGVYVATISLQGIRLAYAVAINGTDSPVSDYYGIPPRIFIGTADSLSLSALEKFRHRIFGDATAYKQYYKQLDDSVDIESLRRQLYAIYADYSSRKEITRLAWNKVFISDDDKIFPALSQRKAWEGRGTIIIPVHGAHYVDLKNIVNLTLIPQNVLADSFSKKMSTYDANAHAQRHICEKLSEKIITAGIASDASILEIGSGTGLLTRRYAPVLSPRKITFLDLCELPHYNLCRDEEYHCCDAEEYIAYLDPETRFDAIFSSSAIQWFSDIPVFFKNCKDHLKKGGLVAISSFLPGNLSELDSIRPAPLEYMSYENLRTMLSLLFNNVVIETEDIELNFPSGRELLRHIGLTGIGGGIRTGCSLSEKINNIPRKISGEYYLTYKVVYIIAS